MPPEVMRKFNDEGTAVTLDGPKCDVFSFAVLALFTVTGVSPHEGLSNGDILMKVCLLWVVPVRGLYWGRYYVVFVVM